MILHHSLLPYRKLDMSYRDWVRAYESAITQQPWWLRLPAQMREKEKKVDFDKLVPSTSPWLAKGDVPDEGLDLTIDHYGRDTVGQGNDAVEKAIIYWAEDVKPMVLNKTNAQRLQIILGVTDTDRSIGKTVNVCNDKMVEMGGKLVGGLRIRAVPDGQGDMPPLPPADLDDDIPFD